MKIPLVIREIESRTDDLEEKAIITRIHEMKEHSLSKLDIVIFYTEILSGKVVLWCFYSSEKIHNSNFQVKISV